MGEPAEAEIQRLIDRARHGEADAGQELLERHRGRLRQMVAARMDRRLAARLDVSDVVQEALADAHGELEAYLRDRPLPFYPWLRRFAWERLMKLHRHHLLAQRRSVSREEPAGPALPDESVLQLADRLLATGTSPSRQVLRNEQATRVRATLAALATDDREVLVMRHLEQMETDEIASAPGITAGAVRVGLLRALRCLRPLLEDRP